MSDMDTIFALSSGAGLCGVSVIRVSGRAAMRAAASLAGRLPSLSRQRLQALIRAGEVTSNGEPCRDLNRRVKGGEATDFGDSEVLHSK